MSQEPNSNEAPNTFPSKEDAVEVLPSEIKAYEQSLLFVERLLTISVSTICFLRGLFPKDAFRDLRYDSSCLKILYTGNYKAQWLIQCLGGAFDALQKQYLRQLMLGVYRNPNEPDTVMECYKFGIAYRSNGPELELTDETRKHTIRSGQQVKSALERSLFNFHTLCQNLKHIDDEVFVTIKLLYYNDRTPASYEPPGFGPGIHDNFNFRFDCRTVRPVVMKAFKTKTGYHSLNLCVESVLCARAENGEYAEKTCCLRCALKKLGMCHDMKVFSNTKIARLLAIYRQAIYALMTNPEQCITFDHFRNMLQQKPKVLAKVWQSLEKRRCLSGVGSEKRIVRQAVIRIAGLLLDLLPEDASGHSLKNTKDLK
ncbi:unnamed protein product [Soboliphyme baturini]|uniref:HORMA domain-containing protein n=1 Tax=Soboliphyme baturini TaxID=241478 RepID=A0A183ILN9_9BILA|nr:unnamed protein product [Soboliphyme baturini]